MAETGPLRLRLRPAARRDLEDIWRFGQDRWGSTQADAYLAELDSVLSLLCIEPGIGVLRADISPPVRSHTHRRHLIVYETGPDTLDVVRILHGRSDWLSRLG